MQTYWNKICPKKCNSTPHTSATFQG